MTSVTIFSRGEPVEDIEGQHLRRRDLEVDVIGTGVRRPGSGGSAAAVASGSKSSRARRAGAATLPHGLQRGGKGPQRADVLVAGPDQDSPWPRRPCRVPAEPGPCDRAGRRGDRRWPAPRRTAWTASAGWPVPGQVAALLVGFFPRAELLGRQAAAILALERGEVAEVGERSHEQQPGLGRGRRCRPWRSRLAS